MRNIFYKKKFFLNYFTLHFLLFVFIPTFCFTATADETIRKAEQLYSRGDLENSIKELEYVLKINPDNLNATEKDKLIAEQLLTPFLNDSDKNVIIRAAKSLFKFNPKKALHILESLLNDTVEEIVSTAIETISSTENVACITRLILISETAEPGF